MLTAAELAAVLPDFFAVFLCTDFEIPFLAGIVAGIVAGLRVICPGNGPTTFAAKDTKFGDKDGIVEMSNPTSSTPPQL